MPLVVIFIICLRYLVKYGTIEKTYRFLKWQLIAANGWFARRRLIAFSAFFLILRKSEIKLFSSNNFLDKFYLFSASYHIVYLRSVSCDLMMRLLLSRNASSYFYPYYIYIYRVAEKSQDTLFLIF